MSQYPSMPLWSRLATPIFIPLEQRTSKTLPLKAPPPGRELSRVSEDAGEMAAGAAQRPGAAPTEANAGRAAGAAGRQKKATSPQLWLTLLWHVGSGLPWAWRTGPSGACERDPLVALVPELPPQALLVADAGFVGSDFGQPLLTAGHHFVIRVGANVRLVRQLGWAREHAQVASVCPDYAARNRQPPWVLRLVVSGEGKHPGQHV